LRIGLVLEVVDGERCSTGPSNAAMITASSPFGVAQTKG
jgi:hypothetical protein